MISVTWLILFSLLPNILEWYSWWCDLFDKLLYQVHFEWCWYWGALYFSLMGGIIKDYIKLFGWYFKANLILCFHEGFVCFYCNNGFIFFKVHENTAWSDDLLIILNLMNIYLIKSHQNFPAGFCFLYWFNILDEEVSCISWW